MGKEYIIGADAGTSSMRVVIYDIEGREVAEGRSTYNLIRPKPGWAEQEAEWWWVAFCKACREALHKAVVESCNIKAIGITHQRQSFVGIDRDGKPVRPAILWMDTRCSKQAEWAAKNVGTDHIYKRTGFMPTTPSIYKVMWLKENEPENYKRTNKWLLVQDYLVYKLTGKIVTASGTATFTGCLDISTKTSWAEDILNAFDIPKKMWPEDILAGGIIGGRVTAKAAKATSLPEGLPVVMTAGDQPCGTLGAGIIEPGIMGINGGTSCTCEVLSHNLPIDPNCNYFIEVSPLGDYLPESAIYSGASALMNWYKNNFGSIEVAESVKRDCNVWEQIYDKAKEVETGSLGLMLIPYFSGAAGPFWDLRARGVIVGFLLDHNRYHIIRAIMEGCAYESRFIKELIEKGSGTPIKEIRMYGGSAISDVWNQIFADVFNLPVFTTETVETTSLGAAICAAKGAGIYKSIKEATKHMVRIKNSYEPKDDSVKIYDKLYELYIQFYKRINDLVHQVSIVTGNP